MSGCTALGAGSGSGADVVVNTLVVTPANTRTSAALATRETTALRRLSTTPPQASLTDVPHALTCEDPGLLSAIGEFPVKTQAGCVAAAGQTQGGGHE
jgi:hypothetical protein